MAVSNEAWRGTGEFTFSSVFTDMPAIEKYNAVRIKAKSVVSLLMDVLCKASRSRSMRSLLMLLFVCVFIFIIHKCTK